MKISGYNAPDREERRKAIREILRREDRDMATDEVHQHLEKWFDRRYCSRTTRNDLAALTKRKVVQELAQGGTDRRARYWKLNRAGLDLVLSPTESMTLLALFQHAERFGLRLETEGLSTLREYVATSISAGGRGHLLAQGRIRSATRFMVLEPGEYRCEHLESVQTALREEACLEVVYRPRGAGDVLCTYLLRPLALSYQDSNIYLSAFIASEEWPKGKEPKPGTPRGKFSSNGPGRLCALMLHRMVSVRPTVASIAEPPGYHPDSLEAQRDLLTIHSDEPVDLELCLSPNLYNRLSENPLSPHQQLNGDHNGGLLKCKIEDTQGLRLFLLGNAADIEVLAPLHLRLHIRDTLRKALDHHDRPSLFNRYLCQWQLIPDGPPVSTLSANLLPVRQHGRPAMLKLSHEPEERAGAQLMAWWSGNGAAQVLALDADALLLDRATGPGSLVAMVHSGQDDEATRILCSVAARLHALRPEPLPPLVPLTRWFDSLLSGNHDPLLERCAATARDLLATPQDITVLHGDIHHGNILDFGAAGWLAIDPKGLYGERGFDYANLFCNPDGPSALLHFAQRVETVSKASDIERHRLLQWILAWAGLSACWMEEDGLDSLHTREVAKLAAAALDQGVQST